MQVYMLPKSPREYDSGEECCNPFNDDDLATAKSKGVTAIFYWYICGSYDGSGELIATRKDGKWLVSCLSHCSCYGPLDDFLNGHDSFDYDSLDSILQRGTEDSNIDYRPLVELARRNGY